MSRVNKLNNRVIFYEVDNSGPEAHGGQSVKVYECAAGENELSMTDYSILDLPAGKQTVTIKIRNVPKAFRPEYHHEFELQAGYFKDVRFRVVKTAPDNKFPHFLKIVGEG